MWSAAHNCASVRRPRASMPQSVHSADSANAPLALYARIPLRLYARRAVSQYDINRRFRSFSPTRYVSRPLPRVSPTPVGRLSSSSVFNTSSFTNQIQSLYPTFLALQPSPLPLPLQPPPPPRFLETNQLSQHLSSCSSLTKPAPPPPSP